MFELLIKEVNTSNYNSKEILIKKIFVAPFKSNQKQKERYKIIDVTFFQKIINIYNKLTLFI